MGVRPRDMYPAVHGEGNECGARTRSEQSFRAYSGHPTGARGPIIIGPVSPLGDMVAVMGGVALAREDAARVRSSRWCTSATAATSTGVFHEAMNFAAVKQLPLVVDRRGQQIRLLDAGPAADGDRDDRSARRGLRHAPRDGRRQRYPRASTIAAKRAVETARGAAAGSFLLGVDTMRMKGHAAHDDMRYVSPEHGRCVDEARSDSRSTARRLVRERDRDDCKELDEIDAMTKAYAESEAQLAAEAPMPDPGDSRARAVSADDPFVPTESSSSDRRSPLLPHGREQVMAAVTLSRSDSRSDGRRDGARRARVPAGRGHRPIWRRVQGHRRPARSNSAATRIVDTPISESAIIGAPVGAAYMGLRPVAELQFIDFITTCFDMVTSFAATSRYRTGAGVPMVVRGPCGAGVSGGPFHSANPEAFFLNTAGLKIVEPSTPYDAKGLLKAAIRDDDPVLFFEHKLLYRRLKEELPADDYIVPIGKAIVAAPAAT